MELVSQSSHCQFSAYFSYSKHIRKLPTLVIFQYSNEAQLILECQKWKMKENRHYKTYDQPINHIMEEKVSHEPNHVTWEEPRKTFSSYDYLQF